jgi:hypothetical protein
MLDEVSQKLLDELKIEFQQDIIKTIRSLTTKIKQDVYEKVVDLIETDDIQKVKEAKDFLTDSTEVLCNDLEKEIINFLDKY